MDQVTAAFERVDEVAWAREIAGDVFERFMGSGPSTTLATLATLRMTMLTLSLNFNARVSALIFGARGSALIFGARGSALVMWAG